MHSVLHAFTHSVVWASVIASAFVALVVTLLVEYLAKPWLEVRKDRILANSREERTAIRNIRRAALLAKAVYVSVYLAPKDNNAYKLTPKWELELILEKVDKMTAEVEELTQKAAETVNISSYFHDEWQRTIASLAGFSRGIHARFEPSDGGWETFYIAAETLSNFAELFASPGWRIWRRAKLVKKIKSSPISQLSLPYDPKKET